MPKVIRQLDQKVWLDTDSSDQVGALKADALKNFRTTENALSIFKVEEENFENSVIRIVTALACGRNDVEKIDYALFEEKLLHDLNIKTVPTDGRTADTVVNRLHIDLVELTGQDICDLATNIKNHGELVRINKKEILNFICSGVTKGNLEIEKMNFMLYSKIKPQLESAIA